MLHQISQLASSAPQDHGLVAGEAAGVEGGAQPGVQDFLVMLARAEVLEGLAPADEIVTGDVNTRHGLATPTASVTTSLVPTIFTPARQVVNEEQLGGQDVLAMLAPAEVLEGLAPADEIVAGDVNTRHVLDEEQLGGQDVLATLAQAGTRGSVASAAETAPGGANSDGVTAGFAAGDITGFVPGSPTWTSQDPPLQAAGRYGAELADGTVPGGNMTLGASPANDALPESPDAASSASVIAAPHPLNGFPGPSAGSVPPVPGAARAPTGSPVFEPQKETPPSDLSPAASGLATVGRSAEPAALAAFAAKVPSDDVAGAKRMAAASASDLDAHPVAIAVSLDSSDTPEVAAPLKSEAVTSQLTGLAPVSLAGSPLPEGGGVPMLADLSMVGMGSMPGHAGQGPSPSSAVASLSLPYQRLLHPQLSAQVAPAVLAMGLVPRADGGPGRLTLAIRPAELGTLQIITERTEEGTARIAVLAERPETLQLLLRDASTLETALRAAGVDEGSGLSLSFGLANQGPGDGAGDTRRDAGHAPGRGDGADPKPAIIGLVPTMARTSLLDLSL